MHIKHFHEMGRQSIIITIIAFFAILDVSAKKKKEYPRAEIKVEYTYPHKRLKTDAKAYDDEYSMDVANDAPDLHVYFLETDYHE